MKVFLILISIVNVTNVPHYKTMFKKDVKVNVDGENEIKITEYKEPYNSNHFYDINHKKYVKCPDGKAMTPWTSDKYSSCNACDIYHKYVRN
ncbi:MAG: hypothetical protein MHPSP_004504, partial [Paramarteilia canceri]